MQYLWDAAKAVLREKFIMIQAYVRKQGNILTLHLRELEKRQTGPKVNRRR